MLVLRLELGTAGCEWGVACYLRVADHLRVDNHLRVAYQLRMDNHLRVAYHLSG